MRDPHLLEPVELTIAADAGMMLVIRLTTAGVVARAGLTIDAMENLKMAVEEACSCLIGQVQPPKRLGLRYVCENGALVISVGALEPKTGAGELDEVELDVVRCILEALADQVEFDVCDGWIRTVRLRAALQ